MFRGRAAPPPPPPDDDFDDDPPPPDDDDDDYGPPPDDDDFLDASEMPSDFDEDEPPDDEPPPEDEEDEDEDEEDDGDFDEDDEDMEAPPSMSERSRPSIGPPPSDIIDDDDDDMAPQASIPSSSPPQSLPGSTRPSMAPPSPPSSDEEDVPPPPSSSPPPRAGAVKLPVKPPNVPFSDILRKAESSKINASMSSDPPSRVPFSDSSGTELLNQGLNIKKLSANTDGRSTSMTSLFSGNDGAVTSSSYEKRLSNRLIEESIRASLAKRTNDGYIEVQGKYEGDPFEVLYIKPSKTTLSVRCSTGEEAVFNLQHNSYVFEDLEDPKCFVLDYNTDIIIFKVKSRDDLTAILAAMPNNVFDVPLDRNKNDASSRAYIFPDDDPAKEKHIKGTSVEELLQGSNSLPINRAELDRIFTPLERRQTTYGVGRTRRVRQRRRELIDSHIKKPTYSIRRVKQLAQWINSLHVWPHQITITNLHKQFCNGLLLANLMKVFIPNLEILHLNEKALAEKPAIDNIEKVLGCIWRSKSVNNSRVPKASEIYNGNVTKLVILLQELFDVYMRKPLYGRVEKLFKWYTSILRQYELPIPIEVFTERDLSDIWPHFQTGTALFCVIYHFHGPIAVGSGANAIRIDPLRVTAEPRSISEFRANVNYVFSLLRALNIEVFWEVDDWITHPDTEFILIQLGNVYEAFKHKQCSLPPAQGTIAGVTSGPNGEPRVVGLVFADTLLSNRVSVERMARTVLLGSGEDALPLLPIDNSGLVDFRYYSAICPQGLLSFMKTSVKIMHATVSLKGSTSSQANDWNGSSAVVSVNRETNKDEGLLNLLRSHNKRSESQDVLYGTSKMSKKAPDETSSVFGLQLLSAPINVSKSASVYNYSLSMADIQSENQLNEMLDKQYKDMLRTLDEDMKQSTQELDSQESDLEARYTELETISDRVSESDYERILNQLDSERKMLESEKYRIEEHYKLRLKSLTVQRQDVFARLKAQLLSARSSSPGSVSVTKSIASSAKITKSKPINEKQAEKGWLSLTAKSTTHNVHINRLQSKAMTSMQTTWTPHKFRTKKADSATDQKMMKSLGSTMNSNTFSAKDLMPVDISETRETKEARNAFNDSDLQNKSSIEAFNRFREKLHIRTEKWFESKNEPQDSHDKDSTKELQNSPPKVKKPTLIPVPQKLINNGDISNGQQESDENKDAFEFMSNAIREEELSRMIYEDERRTLYLNQLPSYTRRK